MIPAGSVFGHYEILSPVGAGGMGEVYRARDSRILREVALKILPHACGEDSDLMRRFRQEALAAGMLNHPNILTVFDIGNHEGTPYIVSEMLEGQTLRDVLSSRISLRKAIDYALQIAHGLAAAHAKGIVHRDIKPENIFVLEDDRVKLLDFGLVKLLRADGAADEVTVRFGTDPGMILGTASYMSPEQVRGLPVDHRSDIFSFGVVLHEMLTGSNPFRRDSQVETMSAILTDDAPMPREIPRGIATIVRHALEKNASNRFESVRDLAFALDAVAEPSSPALRPRKERVPEKVRELEYKRVTFRRGFIGKARYAPGGSLVYGAAWEDQPFEIYTTLPPNPESRPLGHHCAALLDVSQTGELAIALDRRYVAGYVMTGTLARVPLGGGTPRAVCEDVQDAEWTPDGKDFLIVRRFEGIYRIESPIGNVIYETPTWISTARFHPDGSLIAFIEHPVWGDDGGSLVIIDLAGTIRARSPRPFSTTSGLAWTPRGDEVWIAASPLGGQRDLYALSTGGKQRLVLSTIGTLTLHDILPTGEVLVSSESGRREVVAGRAGQKERNLSWFDWSWLGGISRDGEFVLIEEQAAAAAGTPMLFTRPVNGDPATRIGEGRTRGSAVSPDGRWIATTADEHTDILLMPVGAGQTRRIPTGLSILTSWMFYPDGKRLVISGHEAGQPRRLYECPLNGGPLRVIATEPIEWVMVVSPDGDRIGVVGADGSILIYANEGGDPQKLRGAVIGRDVPAGWSADGRSMFVYTRGRHDVSIDTIDIETGERTAVFTIHPADPAGIHDIMPLLVAADGVTYAYGYRRFLSELFVLRGLM